MRESDSGYQGQKFQLGLRHVCRKLDIEIVKKAGQGLGAHEPKRSRVSTMGIRQTDATKALSNHDMIVDGL